jgi:hypothetical protein
MREVEEFTGGSGVAVRGSLPLPTTTWAAHWFPAQDLNNRARLKNRTAAT